MTNTISIDFLARLSEGKSYLKLENKVVFITGAASGIGLSMAYAFAANGAKLILLDLNAEALDQAKQEISFAIPEVEIKTFKAAVNDENAVNLAVTQAVEHFGRIDVLVNNAGVSMNQPTLELSGESWRRAMDINVNGVFYCAQAVGRQMIAQGSGNILNVSSMYGVVAAPERAAYCTSKAAVAMLTKSLAIEWAPLGLRVNAIAPGYVKTALVEELVAKGRMNLEALIKRTPIGRLGQADEIASITLFLASEHASFINGHIVVADGGWSSYSYI